MPPADPEFKGLVVKTLTGLVGVCTAIALGLGTFALKETVAAQLSLRELNVRMLAVETSVAAYREQQATIVDSLYTARLADQRLVRVEADVKEIKTDLRELLKRQ